MWYSFQSPLRSEFHHQKTESEKRSFIQEQKMLSLINPDTCKTTRMYKMKRSGKAAYVLFTSRGTESPGDAYHVKSSGNLQIHNNHSHPTAARRPKQSHFNSLPFTTLTGTEVCRNEACGRGPGVVGEETSTHLAELINKSNQDHSRMKSMTMIITINQKRGARSGLTVKVTAYGRE